MSLLLRPEYVVSYLEKTDDPINPKPMLDTISTSPLPPWYFLALYRVVGEAHSWLDWLLCSPQELDDYCDDPNKRLYTLIQNGSPAGFYVLHQKPKRTVELAYFGLLPQTVGQGLGGRLLDHAIAESYEKRECDRIILNTCTLDHPRALSLYKSRGFVIYDTKHKPALYEEDHA